MRKICLINQNDDSTISLNLFAKLAREGKRVLILDFRENKKVIDRDIGLNIFNCVNELDDFRKFIISLEQNLDVIKGNPYLNFQEFNFFYELFKYDYFEKKLKNLNYDYIVLEVSAQLNAMTMNSIFYSSELMVLLDMEKQGHDFANKFSRFVFHFNKLYGKDIFVSKFIPVFSNKLEDSLYTYLVSEFTSKLVSYPIVGDKNFEFGLSLEKIAVNLIDEEKYFDSRFKTKEKQKQIKEYLEILNEVSSQEVPLTRYYNL